MKENYINLCFVIDESGSMSGSKKDVLSGFNNVLSDQRKITNGKCTISLFKFSDEVVECFIGKDVKSIDGLDYHPNGCTAMNDGIGIAIDRTGEWLANMPEEERPSKNMVVVMTDGMENSSRKYTLEQVRKKIKHQTEKYSWTFVYMGTDITDSAVADDLGFSEACYSNRESVSHNYDIISKSARTYRVSDKKNASIMCDKILNNFCDEATLAFEEEIGKKIKNKK